MENRPKKLIDQVHDAIRVKNYACNTEQSYVRACSWPCQAFYSLHGLCRAAPDLAQIVLPNKTYLMRYYYKTKIMVIVQYAG